MIGKIKQFYTQMKAPVKASLWFLICAFLQKGIAMITMPIFTRVMTEAEYGRYSVYTSWFNILQIIVSLNLAAGVYTRGLVKHEEDQDRFSSSMLGLSTACIVVWSVVYAIFHDLINDWLDLSTVLMVSVFVDIWANAAFLFWSNRERVNYRYKKLVCLTLVYVILRPLLGVLFVKLVDEQHQVEARVLTSVIVNFCLFAGLYIVIARKGRQFFHKQYWLYALKFNLPLVPHYLSQIVLNQSDRLMINSICGPAETAYYNVAYTLAMVLQMLNTSISGTMNPWIYKSIKNRDLKRIGKISYGVLVLIAVANIVVIAVAPELMIVLAPENYQAAVWVIPPVTASVFFMFLYNLFATFEYYFERTHYVTIATIVGAVLNIVLNGIFIPIFGFVAAGYTTLVCYVLYGVAHYGFMRKVCREFLDGYKVYNAAVIFLIGGAVIVASFVLMCFYRMAAVRYALLLAMLLVFLIKRKAVVGLLREIK